MRNVKTHASVLTAAATVALLLSCGASVDKLPIDDDIKRQVAVEAGCAAAASAGCFERSAVIDIVGPIKTSEQCVGAVSRMLDDAVLTDALDIVDMTATVFTCKKFERVLSRLDGLVPAK